MAEQQNNPVFEIHRIYIKNLSFDSPQSPDIFKENTKFSVDVSVDTQATALDGDFFEVALTTKVTTKKENSEDVVYIAEAKQAGIFTVAGFGEAERKQVLNSACANILFPYVRETISELVNRGGFPQLYLAPINFDALYRQQLEQEANANSDANANANVAANSVESETKH